MISLKNKNILVGNVTDVDYFHIIGIHWDYFLFTEVYDTFEENTLPDCFTVYKTRKQLIEWAMPELKEGIIKLEEFAEFMLTLPFYKTIGKNLFFIQPPDFNRK